MTKLSIIYRANIDRDIRIAVRTRKPEGQSTPRLLKRSEKKR